MLSKTINLRSKHTWSDSVGSYTSRNGQAYVSVWCAAIIAQ